MPFYDARVTARTPPTPSGRRRRDEVRDEMRRATLELVEDASFKDLTVDEIARTAGISRSAFYFYFRDKHDLLVATAESLVEDLYREAEVWWHGDGPPRELIRAALEGVVAIMRRHAGLFRVVTEVSSYDEEVELFWRALIGRFVGATAEHLEREQAAGRIRPELSPGPSAEALVWGVERLWWVTLGGEGRSTDELVETLTRLWLGALYLEPA